VTGRQRGGHAEERAGLDLCGALQRRIAPQVEVARRAAAPLRRRAVGDVVALAERPVEADGAAVLARAAAHHHADPLRLVDPVVVRLDPHGIDLGRGDAPLENGVVLRRAQAELQAAVADAMHQRHLGRLVERLREVEDTRVPGLVVGVAALALESHGAQRRQQMAEVDVPAIVGEEAGAAGRVRLHRQLDARRHRALVARQATGRERPQSRGDEDCSRKANHQR
jgi:hypothetical protein